MKLFVLVLSILVPSFAHATGETLTCRVQMYQFKKDQAMFPMIGDTNQELQFNFAPGARGELRAEAEARFVNDQSTDQTNSLHGVKAIATYTQGDGMLMSLKVVKYATAGDHAPFIDIAAAMVKTPYDKDLVSGAKDLTFGYINPKAFDRDADLQTMLATGVLTDYELYFIAVNGCR